MAEVGQVVNAVENYYRDYIQGLADRGVASSRDVSPLDGVKVDRLESGPRPESVLVNEIETLTGKSLFNALA